MRLTLLLAAALSIAACATSRPPERQVVQHPSASDLADKRCIGAEPAALTDAELDSPDADKLDRQFQAKMVAYARSCEGALSRVCDWHVAMGLQLPADLRCRPETTPDPAPPR